MEEIIMDDNNFDKLLETDDSKQEIHPEEYFNAVKERKRQLQIPTLLICMITVSN